MTSFLNNTCRIVGPDHIVKGMAAVKRVPRDEDWCRACHNSVVCSDEVQRGHTDEVLRTPVRSRRHWSHQATAISNRLVKPHHWLVGPKSGVVLARSVFSCAVDLVGGGAGKDNEEGVGGAGAGRLAKMQRAGSVMV